MDTSYKVIVRANEYWAGPFLNFKKDERYDFSARILKFPFSDAGIRANDAHGFTSDSLKPFLRTYMKLFERYRRSPKHPWLHLMGCINRTDDPSHYFDVGTQSENVKLPESGELYFFVNDIRCPLLAEFFYGNNQGLIEVTITKS